MNIGTTRKQHRQKKHKRIPQNEMPKTHWFWAQLGDSIKLEAFQPPWIESLFFSSIESETVELLPLRQREKAKYLYIKQYYYLQLSSTGQEIHSATSINHNLTRGCLHWVNTFLSCWPIEKEKLVEIESKYFILKQIHSF